MVARMIALITVLGLVVLAGTGCRDARDREETAVSPATELPTAESTSSANGLSDGDSGAVEVVAPGRSDPNPGEAARMTELERALAEAKIKEDPNGQWATTATASSTFADAQDRFPFSALQVTGPPDVEKYGDDSKAWASKRADEVIEWIQVGFEKPVHATGVRIRQTYAPGAIIKIELLDEKGEAHTVFDGIDDAALPAWTIVWFERTFPKTEFRVKGARITLASSAVRGWNEIDAIQLIGSD